MGRRFRLLKAEPSLPHTVFKAYQRPKRYQPHSSLGSSNRRRINLIDSWQLIPVADYASIRYCVELRRNDVRSK